MNKLITTYETACNDIVQAFAKKQDLEFTEWVGDTVGGIAVFIEEYFISMDDIVLDLRTEQRRGEILKWYYKQIEKHIMNKDTITYRTYLKIKK